MKYLFFINLLILFGLKTQLGMSQPSQNSPYVEKIKSLCTDMGIDTKEYSKNTGLQIETEATELSFIGNDIYGRPQQLTPEAAKALKKLIADAKADGCNIMVVSAYRSVDYQAGLIQRKLKAGQTIEDILTVNTAPGFSQHHTGKAVDFTTPQINDLTEAFENTAEFAWLLQNACRYGFVMSYPKNNPEGIVYEPWHWYYNPLACD